MTKRLAEAVQSAPMSFDAVPGCSSCDILLNWSGSAWKLGYALLWAQGGALGDVHLMRDHQLGLPGS
ncbi:hypothetical protein ACFQ6C_26165 [Streptomyces sp. NPDC056454]|uniref:hypothetical protein n=1 Tax=Streptomyces sp. NPDC056454 TaxID=3345823 RepID=UPI0036971B9C